jgi:hypothetical protein
VVLSDLSLKLCDRAGRVAVELGALGELLFERVLVIGQLVVLFLEFDGFVLDEICHYLLLFS